MAAVRGFSGSFAQSRNPIMQGGLQVPRGFSYGLYLAVSAFLCGLL